MVDKKEVKVRATIAKIRLSHRQVKVPNPNLLEAVVNNIQSVSGVRVEDREIGSDT